MVDDLFYAGAGLNLGSGGDLSNPLLARQGFPSHYFFAYPPLHSYLLGGWLKLVGINSFSVTSFQLLMYLITTVCSILVLRRHNAPRWAEWLVIPGIWAAFFNIGLRPEPLSAALLASAMAVLECISPRFSVIAIGYLLLALSPIAAPRTLPFALTIGLLSAWHLWTLEEGRGRNILFGGILVGMSVAGLTFLVMIGFRVDEFMTTLLFHASRNTGPKLMLLQKFLFDILGIARLPVLVASIGATAFLVCFFKERLAQIGLVLALGFVIDAALGGLWHGTVWYAVLILIFGVAVICERTPRNLARCISLGAFLILLGANIRPVLGIIGTVSGQISSAPGEAFLEAANLRPTPKHPLVIDSITARYVYEYKIPPGSLDWSFSAPFPGFAPISICQNRSFSTAIQAEFPGDIFVLGTDTVFALNSQTSLHQPVSTWSPLGNRWWFPKRPRDVFIIPATSLPTCYEGRS
jgi:hypothetical protein